MADNEIVKQIGENVAGITKSVGEVEKKLAEADAVVKSLQEKVATVEKNAGDKLAALEKVISAQKELIFENTGTYKGKLPSKNHALLAGHYFLATMMGDANSPVSKAWLDKQGIEIVKAMGTGTTSSGGAVVIPVVLATTILDLVEADYGTFRRDCGKTVGAPDKTPTKEGNVKVYNPQDGGEIKASDLLLGLKDLSYQNWASLSVWTRQLDEFAIVSIGELMTTSIAEAIGEKEDECGFVGDGTPTYFGVTGLMNAVGAAGVVEVSASSIGNLTLMDILTGMCKLPRRHRKTAKFYGEATVLAYCYGVKDAAGNQMPLAQIQMENGDLPRLATKPVEEVPCMPDISEISAGSKFLIFGSLQNAATIATKSSMVIERSSEFGFANHTQAIKSYEVKAIQVVHPGTATKVGAYIVFKLKS
jgi:HK97 family phage major capsid protein